MTQLNEKATSKAQQRYMAMVATGKIPAPKGLSKKEARKMARTKHDDLPERVSEHTKTFKEFLLSEGDVVPFRHAPTDKIRMILDMPIKGNAYHDGHLMQLIHDYVVDENNPMKNRILAIKKLDKVMGQPDVDVTEKDVREYIKQGM